MIFIYILLGIMAIVAILAFTLPSKYYVEKTMTMHTNVSNVFKNVANLENYKNWNPWQKLDPEANNTITGEPFSVGHQYEWNGKKVGVGKLTIKSIQENKAVHFNLQFIKPWSSKANDDWKFEAINDNECKVTWSNSGNLPAGMARLMGPMIKSQLNKQFIQGLSNLKALSNG